MVRSPVGSERQAERKLVGPGEAQYEDSPRQAAVITTLADSITSDMEALEHGIRRGAADAPKHRTEARLDGARGLPGPLTALVSERPAVRHRCSPSDRR